MPRPDTIWTRVARWCSFGAREDARVRREIDDEIDAHLAARIDHLIARGLSPEAARAEALRRFGDLAAGRALLHADALVRRRRLRLGERLDAIRQDVRYVTRTLGRSPAFTAGVVMTFALGLGINAAIFRVADVVLFRAPAGVRDAGGLRQVETVLPGTPPTRVVTFSWPDTERIVASGAFAALSAGTPPRQIAGADGRQFAVSYCDDACFRLLGVALAAGRGFTLDEARPGAQLSVAVVSHAFWKRELGGRPLGEIRPLSLGGRVIDVVGVTAEGFTGIDLEPTDVWLPIGVAEFGRGFVNGVTIPWYQTDMLRSLRLIGRMPPGVSNEVVRTQLAARLSAVDVEQSRPARVTELRAIVPIGRAVGEESANRVLLRLAGVAGLILLIAAANATNLLLARGIRRRPELAIRAALGASRGRLCGLLLVESTMLALAGGAAAALAGSWTAEALRRLLFPDGRWTSAGFDGRTVFFVGTLAVAAGLAAGLAPTLQATGLDLHGTLKDGRGRGGGRTRRTRAGLLVTQTALALALLVASGLLVVSLLRLNQTRLGFDPSGLVTASLSSTSPSRLFQGGDRATFDTFADSVRSGPGLQSMAFASAAPFGASARTDFRVPGSTFTPAADNDQPLVMNVSPAFALVMGTHVVWGRFFTDDDVNTGPPVSVVNASMARAYWGDRLPPGACILIAGQSCAMVIGIIEDIRESPAAVAPMRFYLPLYPNRPPGVVLARTRATDARGLVDRIRAAVPSGYRATIEVTSDRLDRALRPWRTAAWLFLALGAVALALACGGIYSVMTYVATERRHEIGVRVALGATHRDVLRLIIMEGVRLVVVGGAIGVAVAAVTGRLLGSLLFAVSPFDPAVYLTSFIAVVAAAVLATWWPAGRAARVDAVVALRQD